MQKYSLAWPAPITEGKGLGFGHRASCRPAPCVECVPITAQYSVTWYL